MNTRTINPARVALIALLGSAITIAITFALFAL